MSEPGLDPSEFLNPDVIPPDVELAELGKDVGDKKDHAWFVSFAPAYKPEIAVIALIENVGFGGSHAAPAVKGIYERYISLRHPEGLPEGSAETPADSN